MIANALSQCPVSSLHSLSQTNTAQNAHHRERERERVQDRDRCCHGRCRGRAWTVGHRAERRYRPAEAPERGRRCNKLPSPLSLLSPRNLPEVEEEGEEKREEDNRRQIG